MAGGFGGSGGGGGSAGNAGSQSTTATTTQNITPEQRRLLDQVVPTAENFLQDFGEPFPDSAVAPFTADQNQAFQLAREVAGRVSKEYLPYAQSGLDFTNFLFGPALDPRTNPGLQGAIDAAVRPISRELTQSVLPQLRSGTSLLGTPGSSRQGIAEGLASQSALTAIGDTSANVVNPAYLGGLQAATQALGYLPSTIGAATSLELLPANIYASIGAQQQQQEQALINQSIGNYYNKTLFPFLAAEEVARLAFAIPGGTATSTTETLGPPLQQPGALQSGLGGASLGAGIGSAINPTYGPIVGGLLGGLGGLVFS